MNDVRPSPVAVECMQSVNVRAKRGSPYARRRERARQCVGLLKWVLRVANSRWLPQLFGARAEVDMQIVDADSHWTAAADGKTERKQGRVRSTCASEEKKVGFFIQLLYGPCSPCPPFLRPPTRRLGF
jgi:uncharacterized cysteine cluster protein YcgN (CxxCxxCC family)